MDPEKSTFLQILKRKEALLFLIIFIAVLSLLGWLSGEIIIDSGSLIYIPIAPSTALLFFILSTLLILNLNFKKSRIIGSIIPPLFFLAALFCLLIILDYIFNFIWDIENIFIANPQRFGEVPIGRMSPITSVLFFFTGISIMAGRQHNSNTIRYIGGSFSLLTCFIASVLFIGYLYKAPLLYGGQMIPVAFPTAICFLLFSVTLLRVSELKFWTFNLIKKNTTEFLLLKTFLPLVVFIVVLQGFIGTNFSVIHNNPTLSSAIVILIIVVLTIFVVIKASFVLGGKLMRAEIALRESESRAKAMYQAIPDLMFRLNRQSVFLDYKAESKDLYTQSNENIIGNNIRDIFPPEFAEMIDHKICTSLDTKTLQTFEYKLPMPGLGMRDYEARMIVSGADEVMATVRDITDRKLAEVEVQLKNEELISFNAEKDKFFSIIAHDLRGPFSGFLGLTQIMAEDLPNLTMAQVQDFAVSMSKSATNLYQLLENLLEWSQIQKGSIPFNPAAIQLRSIVDEVLALGLETAKSKEIEISCDIPEGISVFADSHILQTVIRNLTSNAVKFTHKGGKVILSAKATNDKSIEISIKDSGIGLSQKMIENLFRLDVQTGRKGTEGEPSTGLGLLLCKEFVEKHGGTIWVESEVGKGSVFYFIIPDGNDRLG